MAIHIGLHTDSLLKVEAVHSEPFHWVKLRYGIDEVTIYTDTAEQAEFIAAAFSALVRPEPPVDLDKQEEEDFPF